MRRFPLPCAALLSMGLVRADDAPTLQVTTLAGKSFDFAAHRGQVAPSGLPTTVVIAPDGHAAKTFVGLITAKDLDGIVTKK